MKNTDPKSRKVAISVTLTMRVIEAIDVEAMKRGIGRSKVIDEIFQSHYFTKPDELISELELELLRKTD